MTVKTKDNKLVYLNMSQWRHIAYRHPEMVNKMDQVEEALQHADVMIIREDKRKYYKYQKDERKYVMVAVRMLNGDGFIITSYMTRKVER